MVVEVAVVLEMTPKEAAAVLVAALAVMGVPTETRMEMEVEDRCEAMELCFGRIGHQYDGSYALADHGDILLFWWWVLVDRGDVTGNNEQGQGGAGGGWGGGGGGGCARLLSPGNGGEGGLATSFLCDCYMGWCTNTSNVRLGSIKAMLWEYLGEAKKESFGKKENCKTVDVSPGSHKQK